MASLPISLPEGFSPIVSIGMDVKVGQILAQKLSAVEVIINIPESLQIPFSKVKKVLKKNPGDKIARGDIIAVKKNLFGKPQAKIVSEIEGTVSRYERNTGNLVIRTDEQTATNEIISPVDGKVDLCNNKEIVIQTDKAIAGGSVVSGTYNEGELFILEESFIDDGASNALYYLDSRAIGKVVLGGKITRDILIKGVGIGTAGFVGINIQEQDIEYLKEKNITLPVIEVDMDSMLQLKQWKGKRVLVDAQNKTVVFLQT